jgi:hypothetical protein
VYASYENNNAQCEISFPRFCVNAILNAIDVWKKTLNNKFRGANDVPPVALSVWHSFVSGTSKKEIKRLKIAYYGEWNDEVRELMKKNRPHLFCINYVGDEDLSWIKEYIKM